MDAMKFLILLAYLSMNQN